MNEHESHDERRGEDCAECQAEFDAAYAEHIGSYRAEKKLRESIAIAREDLDMPNADERELMDAVLLRLK